MLVQTQSVKYASHQTNASQFELLGFHYGKTRSQINPLSRTVKTILWYDTHYQSMVGHSFWVNMSLCTFNRCKFRYVITESDPQPKEPFDADAIVIQSKSILTLSPPPRRDKDQVFVMAVRDTAPGLRMAYTNKIAKQWIPQFNWTMTFRLDSDLVYKYSDIIKKDDTNNMIRKDYNSIFDAKENNAVWIVSHCKTQSHREDYVRELRKVVDIDIYGRCGRETCPKRNFSCWADMERKYKYYLAFENSFYPDYVTEKMFTWFNRNMIVVVRGGADYTKFAPPGTVIDANDFKSAAELGVYMKKVAADKDMYLGYLRRKDRYQSVDREPEIQRANCQLCEYLHTLDDHRKTYPDIVKWWHG